MGKRAYIGSVRIGAVDYRIYEERAPREGDTPLLGAVRYLPSEMVLDRAMGEQHRRVRLWHECIHAIVRQAGYEDLPEGLIDALAYAIVGVLRDNRGNALLMEGLGCETGGG